MQKTRPVVAIFILIPVVLITSGYATIELKMDSFTTIRNGDYGEVQRLIEEGADVNAQDNQGHTALMYASGAKFSQLKGNVNSEVIQLLLEAGANVHISNAWGRTALHFAVRRKLTETADLQVCAFITFLKRTPI